MRWPLFAQLLLPMLAVVAVAIALVSGIDAWRQIDREHAVRQEALQRVKATVTSFSFPLSLPVLRQMSNLSGADFVVVDRKGRVLATTLLLDNDGLATLAEVPATDGQTAAGRNVSLAERPYLCERVSVAARAAAPGAAWLYVLTPREPWWQVAWPAAWFSLVVATGAGVLAVVLATVVARRFSRRIRKVVEQTTAIARGEFVAVPPGARNDELRDLARALNEMAERLDRYESQVCRDARLQTLAQHG